MKKWIFGLLPALALVLMANKEAGLKLGAVAPLQDHKMTHFDGSEHTLNSLKTDRGLLVVFSCNTCPYVIGWEDTFEGLSQAANEAGMNMVLVNSNEAFRDGVDSQEAMSAHASEMGYNVPYVIDHGSKLADAFGAQTTPHVFLFDGAMKLIYKGSINDKYENKEKVATKEYLLDALQAYAAGKKIEPASTRQIGCSIKRVEKK
jgi:thioredoxin-related protein